MERIQIIKLIQDLEQIKEAIANEDSEDALKLLEDVAEDLKIILITS